MIKIIRRLLAVAAIALAPTLVEAQTAALNGLVSNGTPPTGFTVQGLQFNCNNAVPASGQCWPYLQIYDGTTKATVNANGGANVNILGTLPAYAAIPAFKVDQTTPGTTNLVQVGGTLPAYAANPTVKIDQTTPGTTNGVVVNNTLTALVNSADNIAPVSTVTATAGASPVNSYGFLFDGTNWDRQRGTTGGFALTNPGLPAAWGIGAAGSAPPSGMISNGAVTGGATGGLLVGIVQANTSISISQSATALTQIIALAAGQKIYVTSYEVVASGGANTVQFEYGTGTNCATGTTALTGVNSYAANGGATRGGGLGPILVVPAGNALCLTLGSATSVTGSLAYAQF